MFEDKNVGMTLGESVIEACHIIRNTLHLLEESKIGSDEERQSIQRSVNTLIEQVEESFLRSLFEKHPYLRTVNAYPDIPGDGSRQQSTDVGRESEALIESQYLDFSNREVAILIRQAILNVVYILDRSCQIYVWQGDVMDAQKELYKRRIGRIMARVFGDLLEDLLIAHPELATHGWKEFDWKRAKENRDRSLGSSFK